MAGVIIDHLDAGIVQNKIILRAEEFCDNLRNQFFYFTNDNPFDFGIKS